VLVMFGYIDSVWYSPTVIMPVQMSYGYRDG
jgi:hypothetical protein